MSTWPDLRTVDADLEQRALEESVARIVLQELVDTDLTDGSDWAGIETTTVTHLVDVGSPDRVVAALVRTTMIVQEYLLEMACRPTTGRHRSTVISNLSRVVRETTDQPLQRDVLDRIRGDGTEIYHLAGRRNGARVVVDTGRQIVTVAGQPVAMSPTHWRILVCLLVNHDRIVTDDELLDAGWSDQPISRATLATTISKIRSKLGDDGTTQHLIRTTSKRGYRLVADVLLCHRRPSAGASTARLIAE